MEAGEEAAPAGPAIDEWAESMMPFLPPSIVQKLREATAECSRGGLVELSTDVGRHVRVSAKANRPLGPQGGLFAFCACDNSSCL